MQKPNIDSNNIPAFFEEDVLRWSESRNIYSRFESFGIPTQDIKPLFDRFVSAIRSGQLSTPEGFEKYGLIRFAQQLSPNKFRSQIDIIYSTIFFAWASDPAHQSILEEATSPSTILTIQRLTEAADRFYPAESYSAARKMHRKIIMHVGPTNSGKTHHALRALAAAEVGVYAGPLRLLAHEIWERLNLGQIVPLGVEEEEPMASTQPKADADSAFDGIPATPAVQRRGNPKYARKCNMVTGEEQKIVEEGAPLLSCTVEMLAMNRQYGVAVIDEIQMISDEQRGYGWTNAVLGICAKEVHLCGEETAVPLIQALLKDTGDELIVKRYERLTPLEVEAESLGEDLSLVRKGDCIVTFRRSSIFAIKRTIEARTGMRCAVVYGKLPPEIRSEQAALFNDPNSDYDVMIGSDAIGMGLNLKIRRIIFEAVKKFDGGVERYLSVSQVKQIAGRAGRYGLHGDEAPGGFTTTLCQSDLPFLRKTIGVPVEPLQFARLGPSKQSFAAIANALPPGSSTETIYTAHAYVSRLHSNYRYAELNDAALAAMCDFIDVRGAGLTMADRVTFMMAPIPWRDDTCLQVVAKFIRMYNDRMDVDLMEALRGTSFMETMLGIERRIAAGHTPRATAKILEVLETFHKALVVYLWMSFRNPVSYNNIEEVSDLKMRLEKVLDWSLEGVSRSLDLGRGPWKDVRALRDQDKIVYSTLRDVKSAQRRATA